MTNLGNHHHQGMTNLGNIPEHCLAEITKTKVQVDLRKMSTGKHIGQIKFKDSGRNN